MKTSYLIFAVCALSITQPVAANDDVETRVFLNSSCVIADEPVVVEDFDAGKGLFLAGIVSAVAQSTIRNVVRGVAGAIRSSGRGKNHVYEAEQDIYLYRTDFGESADAKLNGQLGCVTLVSGHFEAENFECVSDYEPATMAMSDVSADSIDALRKTRSSINVLRRSNICLATTPKYVFETRIVLADDRSAFRMEGAGFEVNQLRSTRRDKDTRSVLSTYSILEPSADGSGRLIANTWMRHGELASGTRLLPTEDTNKSGWTRLPVLSGAARSAYVSDAIPYKTLTEEARRLESGVLKGIREQSALNAQAKLESETVAEDLRRAAKRLDTQIALQTARLSAVQAEHEELPNISQDYMLVKFRVSITESQSEAAMKLWLANMIEVNSRQISLGVSQIVNDRD